MMSEEDNKLMNDGDYILLAIPVDREAQSFEIIKNNFSQINHRFNIVQQKMAQ